MGSATNESDCSVEKLSTGTDTYTCLVCNAGYGFNAGTCAAMTTTLVPEYCASDNNTAIECNYCFPMTVDSITYRTY